MAQLSRSDRSAYHFLQKEKQTKLVDLEISRMGNENPLASSTDR